MQNPYFPHRYNLYTEYFKKQFGQRVQKLAVNAGFTCPNRDGSKSFGGCTYCINDAFNPSYCTIEKTITEQIREGIEFHKKRYRKATDFLVYFQPYSNTYATINELKKKYQEALSFPNVIGLVIGTRPDCINAEILEYLQQLSKKYYIIVEFGIESIYDETLKKINRCHTFSDTIKALEMAKSYDIFTGGHIIFGLPGETRDMMLKSIDTISKLPLNTIKFHQLQILKGSKMEEDYILNPINYDLFDLNEYIDFIIDVTEKLNPSFVIERFAAEVPPRFTHHAWGNLRYDNVLNLIKKRMEDRNAWQGRLM